MMNTDIQVSGTVRNSSSCLLLCYFFDHLCAFGITGEIAQPYMQCVNVACGRRSAVESGGCRIVG
jgi:hypothetical protein